MLEDDQQYFPLDQTNLVEPIRVRDGTPETPYRMETNTLPLAKNDDTPSSLLQENLVVQYEYPTSVLINPWRDQRIPGEKTKPQRPQCNSFELAGPTQVFERPLPEYIAQQERDLPHLPISVIVQEQDTILSRVNECLLQCALDFVARYQFPIPVSHRVKPVKRPEDREWTEWVYLLKRLAIKRRMPARVRYASQIKEFVSTLENSLEMQSITKQQPRAMNTPRYPERISSSELARAYGKHCMVSSPKQQPLCSILKVSGKGDA